MPAYFEAYQSRKQRATINIGKDIVKIVVFGLFFDNDCRNPTLAKCGGEARHLEKVRIWSPPRLPNV